MRTWFFDLDGTLADTDADIRVSWRAAMEDLGLVCDNFERDFVAGPPIEVMFKRLFPGQYTEELALKLRERFGFHYDGDGLPNTREYPGVLDAVRALKARGDRVFIATNKRLLGALAISRKFGWGDVFEGVYTGDMHKDDAIGKLAKGPLLALAMKENALRPDDCTMVGDTASDFNAASENAMRSIGVTWGYGRPDELALATRLVSTPQEILRV